MLRLFLKFALAFSLAVVCAFLSIDGIAFVLRHLEVSMAYVTAVALTFGIIFAALFTWYWATPLQSLRWAIHQLADGKLDTRVSHRMGRRRDGLANLGYDFDRMAQRLEDSVGAQRRLLHDVSHEIRSPLARLELAVELERGHQLNSSTEGLNRISDEVQRLNALVGEILLLARLENGIQQLELETVDVMELICEIADDARFEAQAVGCDVDLIKSGTFVAKVSGQVLYRAYENIVRNAVKYTRPSSTVIVSAVADNDCLVVTVDDYGHGLSDAEIDTMFQPFRRFSTALHVSGFGLGLTIALRAMQSHGGSISATRNQRGALRMELVLTRLGLEGMAPK